MEILPGTAHRLLARVAEAQSSTRLPSLVAGIVRDGQLVWHGGRGRVGGEPPTADTQYRIGSITKTFTAVLVMRLRDEGRLALTDALDEHLAGSPYGDRTIGQLLSHGSGLQAETAGPWWERTPGEPWEQTVAPLDRGSVPHAPGRRFHYSNLGFGTLGEVVARLRGMPWFEALAREVLAPLELRRTTYRPEPPFAPGLGVHPWADTVIAEPEHDHGLLASAGQLWSTLEDLARWCAFLLGDTGDVLARDTLEEMAQPALVDDTGNVPGSYGLGLQVEWADGRRFVGHGGAMPGFVSDVFVDPDARLGGVWAANSTYGGDRDLTPALLEIVRECEPPVADEWLPSAPPVPLELLGTWYWGPNGYGLRARGDDLLELAPLEEPERKRRFRRVAGEWVGLDGYFAGERLRFDPGGGSFDLATFVFTRAPYEGGPIPGGVDPEGWRAR